MTKSLRESVGSALASGSLTYSPRDEGPLDRVVASAWTGERLGALLWRLKYAKDRTTHALRKALWEIVARNEKRGRYGKERPTPALVATCAAALDEWMNDECPSCQARGYVRLEQKPKACGGCTGTGRIEWTDEQRAEKLAGAYDRILYERVIARLQEADQRQHNQTKKGLRE